VKGDKRVAAELLRVSLKTIYNKLKEYQLEP
jgi:DNA-binding NtrC family response regulator